MKILVTGGAGFIGSNFVRYWSGRYPGDQIRVLDKLTYAGRKENLSGIEMEFIQGDICDKEMVAKAMMGIGVVVHFAAESHVDRSIIDPDVFLQTNVLGTAVLLRAAINEKVKLFHHVSTDEVFGSLELKGNNKFNEDTPYNPHSPYSASKAGSDHLVRAYHDTYGLPITISNTSNNYGPYHDPEKLIPRFITNLIEGHKVPLMGVGENVRDWCYVLDHCRGVEMIIQKALEDSSIIGQTFCLGGNSEKTNLQVTQEILKNLNLGDDMIEYVKDRLGHDARYAINSAKAKKVLGWEPQYTFENGLAKTVQWYKENETWWKPLKKNRPMIDFSEQQKFKLG